jgi:hypothetical protein
MYATASQAIATTAWEGHTAGLEFPVTQNHWYGFEFCVQFSGTGATSGIKVGAGATGTVGTGGTQIIQVDYPYHITVEPGTMGTITWKQGMWTNYAGTMSTGATIGAANVRLLYSIKGSVKAGTGGTYRAQFASNRGTGGQVLILPGSWGWYTSMGSSFV